VDDETRSRMVRRAVHVGLVFSLVYYLMPVDLPVLGLRRWVLLIGFIAVILGFEVYRLRKNMVFLGLRPHEKNQIASFAYAATGLVMVMWLFPHEIAAVSVIGLALIDPLLGELRRLRIPTVVKVLLPMGGYWLIALSVLHFAGGREIWEELTMGAAAMLVAIPSEWFKIEYVDDDFLMLLTPAIVMAWLSLIL